jgi:drug/metabolite transporter (DMT)-like permease
MPIRLQPFLFIVLSGSGFVGTRLGLPYAEPFTFLAWRFALAGVVLIVLALLLDAPWPRDWRRAADVAVAGLLTVGVFSGGVFYSIALGLPPAVSALIIALQPILVAIGASRLLGERIGWRRGAGLLLGLTGVVLVVSAGWRFAPDYLWAAALSGLGLLGMVAGNLWQKARCAGINVFSGGALQYAACALACSVGAALCEEVGVRWTGEFVVALLWMALVVSVGAVSLLFVMIRDGEISRVAALFYGVPVATAVCAWLVFGQRVEPVQWLGVAVVAGGVILATGRQPAGR